MIVVKFFLKKKRPKISLLIPFSTKDPFRKRTFEWLLDYWKHELPDAEIVVGHSKSTPFCKGEALNDAARRAKGRILVLIDADAYIGGGVIEGCADKILLELERGNNLWFVPYRYLFRLTREFTEQIISSDPTNPLRVPCPPPDDVITNQGHMSKYGHRYGAMMMIFPREALDALGCFDERFKGWGGEDIAFLRALDTLWGKHKSKKGCIFHLWHPVIGDDYKSRRWEGQSAGESNKKLAMEYHKATRHPQKMRKLVDDGCCKKDLEE